MGAHDGIRTRDPFKSPSTSLRSASGTPPACRCAPPSGLFYGAHDGIRTRDPFKSPSTSLRSASGTPPACRCAPPSGLFYGAHDGIRTRDLFLTKEVLYRLSYMGPSSSRGPRAGQSSGGARCDLWSGKRDSNPRPRAWKARALPTELFPPIPVRPRTCDHWWRGEDSNLRRRTPADLQSAPFGHSGTSPLRKRSRNQSRWADLNRQPTDYKSVALPLSYIGPRIVNQFNYARSSGVSSALVSSGLVRRI